MTRKAYANPNRADMLRAFERLVSGPAEAEKDFVNRIPTELALYILDLAKQAPWPRGPHAKSSRHVIPEAIAVTRARHRKRHLMKSMRMKADDAARQAATEIKAATGCKLSVTAIVDRMKRRQPKRKTVSPKSPI